MIFLRCIALVLTLVLTWPAFAAGDLRNPVPSRTTIGQMRVPMIVPSSGSMGNNGALTMTTALDQTYPSAYYYMPANAIVAGSTAGFYYGVGGSTTTAVLFNQMYVSGTATVPPLTPFSTTGPGAYAQTTGAFLTAWTMTLPGNTLGLYDEIQAHGITTYLNSAGAKSIQLGYGTGSGEGPINYFAVSPTTTASQTFQAGFANAGALNKQIGTTIATGGMTTSASVLPPTGAVVSSSDRLLTCNLKIAVATDYVIMQTMVVERVAGSN